MNVASSSVQCQPTYDNFGARYRAIILLWGYFDAQMGAELTKTCDLILKY